MTTPDTASFIVRNSSILGLRIVLNCWARPLYVYRVNKKSAYKLETKIEELHIINSNPAMPAHEREQDPMAFWIQSVTEEIRKTVEGRVSLCRRLSKLVYSDPAFATALESHDNTERLNLLKQYFDLYGVGTVMLQENHPFYKKLVEMLAEERAEWQQRQKQ
ncbi:hypothetical protein BJV82DRAFT_41655 [Fennellomyces sp. T-0311]|nr:hypothetical protein BJV82DRAFT_41655 [Fennellomyces sp. T-0311]